MEHLNRRAVVVSLLATSAGSMGTAYGAERVAVRDEAMAALQPYVGVYELPGGHSLGVDSFLMDSGETSLLFCDYQTSLVRPLFQTAPDEFAMGPNFTGRSPIEQTVQFQKDGRATFVSLTVRPTGGSPILARKIEAPEQDVVFPSVDVSLAGSFTVPPGPGPHPAIILLHGSGPLTRYSFGPYRRFFNSLGLAVLVYDKRGTGKSTGIRLDASTGAPETLWPGTYPDDLLADARAALRFLQSRPEIDKKRIGFWGSSEGGMLATQVAAGSKQVAFAINSSGFMGPLWRTILYQGVAMLKAGGTPEAEIAEALAFNQFWMQVAQTGKGYDEFVARRDAIIQSGKKGRMFYMNGAFTSLAQMRWAWSHILAFDSLPALAHVTCPVLGLFGQSDVLTDAPEASKAMRLALLAGGNPDVTTKIIPNASHSLMQAPSRVGMAPGVFDTLQQWLLARVLIAPIPARR